MSIQVVTRTDRSFELSTAELEKKLLQNGVKDREIVVISIAGAFRKGKSFMLNFFLKYLNEKYVKKSIGIEWLDDGDERLTGFEWKHGSSAVTSGIHIWGEIFTHDYEDGRKVAIILVDTQGTFDSRTSMKDCTMIFALSTLLSSVQIYNVMQNIQEDDLQHLQLFSEIGRLAAHDRRQPFQKLLFLVRDWNYQKPAYGLDGGQEFLKERLGTSEVQQNELRLLRIHLRSCFDEMQCFLMPYPGTRVTTDNAFTGQLKEIKKDFIENLKVLIPHLLSPEKLVVKKINGCPIKANQFLGFFKRYFEVLTAGDMPQAKPIFEATAEVFNSNAVQESQNQYASNMQNFNSIPFRINDSDLREQHRRARREAAQSFEERRLLGSDDYILKFKQMLDEWLEAKYREIEQRNKAKQTLFGVVSMLVLTAASFFFTHPSAATTENIAKAFNFIKFMYGFIRNRYPSTQN